MKVVVILIFLVIGLVEYSAGAGKNPIEIGSVQWGRDLDTALEKSSKTGKPVLVLFQEVPGCSGCKKFGGDVLTNPLLVEAIEDEFYPVLVYNNRDGGKDEELLKRFQEPAWNYQVIRFLSAEGDDIVPRKDRIWTTGGVASRMIDVLKVLKRSVPKYLIALAEESNSENYPVAAFAMSCFWTGEVELGKIEGVISTEAGWLGHSEVTLVKYNEDLISFDVLARKAVRAKCGQKVYSDSKVIIAPDGIPTERLDAFRYRKARASDQKKQIQEWKVLQGLSGLTAMQLTKINAIVPFDKSRALEWLSPRQLKSLTNERQSTSATRKGDEHIAE